MNDSVCSLVIAMLLAGCLPPQDQRILSPAQIDQRVMPVKGWDMGCDNLSQCVAIAALPSRKVQMNGIRGALRINLGHPDGLAAGLTIVPLDSEKRLPSVTPTLKQAEDILEVLRDGDEYMIWVEGGLNNRYYLPAKGFQVVEQLYLKWLDKNETRWVQQEPIIPVKGVRVDGFHAPLLTDTQLAECDSHTKGSLIAAWDVGAKFRLLQYACSDKGSFFAEGLWFTLDRQSGYLSPIGLEEAVGPKSAGKAAGLYNTYFESQLGLLVTRKYAATADCGIAAAYAATPSGFVLAERREARHCVGLFIEDWVRTYRDPAVILPEVW